jgi:3-oxoacyl-[acyl-carrier protein] reductase
MPREGRLSGSTAIVTGASGGICEVIAKTFAREGAAVAIASRNVSEAKRVGAEIEATGGSALVIQVDVTQSQEVDRMVKAVLDRWGTIDILVNAVGGFHHVGPVTDIEEEEWDHVIALNLKSAFLCVRAVAKIMMERRKGRIINIGSQSGTGPNPVTNSCLPYACAKAGVIVFTKHLAKQLGPYGITVNTVSPGTTLKKRPRIILDAETMNKRVSGNALRCLVDPQDTADAVLFLASNEGRHITGVNLNVSAGQAII